MTRDEPKTTPDEQAKRDRSQRRLEALAWALDARFKLPGVNTRIGYDALIGLIPGVGDAVSALLSLYIIIEAGRMGASRGTRLGMLARVVADWLLGSVPVAGDAFDVFYKANLKNLEALGIEPRAPGTERVKKV